MDKRDDEYLDNTTDMFLRFSFSQVKKKKQTAPAVFKHRTITWPHNYYGGENHKKKKFTKLMGKDLQPFLFTTTGLHLS